MQLTAIIITSVVGSVMKKASHILKVIPNSNNAENTNSKGDKIELLLNFLIDKYVKTRIASPDKIIGIIMAVVMKTSEPKSARVIRLITEVAEVTFSFDFFASFASMPSLITSVPSPSP